MAATSSTSMVERVLKDLGQEQIEGPKVYCDNKTIISMTKNQVYDGRTNCYVDIRTHFTDILLHRKKIAM